MRKETIFFMDLPHPVFKRKNKVRIQKDSLLAKHFAAFLSSALNHILAILRRHAFTKSMLSFAF